MVSFRYTLLLQFSSMMVATMVFKHSVQYKRYRQLVIVLKLVLSTTNPLIIIKNRFNQSQQVILLGVLAALLVTGCQTVSSNDVIGKTNYQKTASRSDNHNNNLNQQEIARVRTLLAAQYIRKNELDTAQQ